MLSKERYQRTFSQLRPSRDLEWEKFERMSCVKKRSFPLRPLLVAAAELCLLVVLSVTAVATNFLGLRDLLLPHKQEVNVIDRSTGAVVPGKTQEVDAVSLSGCMDSPEGKALAEWEDFLDGYDQDHAILDQVGNYLDPALEDYLCYLVYTQDMADKLEEIAAKYALELHREQIDLTAHPEALGPLAEFAKDPEETYWMYMYEDGSCHFDGRTAVEGWGPADVQFQRAVKGSFNDVTLNIGDAAAYEQWNYKTSSGVEVVLALGPGKSLIFADLPDCFASFNVLQGTERGMTREWLEGVAERYDFSKLSPVERPTLLPEPSPGVPAGERTDAETVYAKVLREVLYGGVLPDGRGIDAAWGDLPGDQFAVCDVDFDGEKELVVLHTTDIMAGMVGYVVEFDPTYTGTGDPISIRLTEFPALTFYENGAVKAESSHNQTWGELWPYTLYTYDPESDLYTIVASVYAADKALMEEVGKGEEYPAQADKSGSGTVYYVSFPYGSGVEPAGERCWDREAYYSWLDSVLGRAQPIELPYLSLTEENIAATLGGKPPIQTAPSEGMPKG